MFSLLSKNLVSLIWNDDLWGIEIYKLGLEGSANFLDDLRGVADPAASLKCNRLPSTPFEVIFSLRFVGVELRLSGNSDVQSALQILLYSIFQCFFVKQSVFVVLDEFNCPCIYDILGLGEADHTHICFKHLIDVLY